MLSFNVININVAPPPPRLRPLLLPPTLFFLKILRNSNENLGVSNCILFSRSIKTFKFAG